MKVLENFRLVLLVVLVLVSIYFVVTPYLSKPIGVTVTFKESNAKCNNVDVGDTVVLVSGKLAENVDEFYQAVQNVKKDEFVALVVNSRPASCLAVSDGDLGITVKNVEAGSLKFGIDIEGGTRVLLEPKSPVDASVIEDAVGTLNTRINLYGLRDMRVTSIDNKIIQIEIGGTSGNEIRDFLARQGRFEGKVLYNIQTQNGKGNLILGDKNFDFKATNESFTIDNKNVLLNGTFSLDEISYTIGNVTENSASFFANVFSGDDIVTVFTDPQRSSVQRVEGGYEFVFTLQISQDSAKRFAKLTANQPITFTGNEKYIMPKLVLFLDDQPVTELNIVSDLAGQEITTPSVQGFRDTREGALVERQRLQTILRSGSLPVELNIIKIDTITQTAGREFINSTIFVMLAAAVAVSAVILFRYRSLKISIPMVIISFSEILIILGFAAMTQIVMKGGGWVLDIASIAGLIAVIGTGVNQLIIITDQILMDRDESLRYRERNALSIIYNSAYTVIAAMLPLLILGFGMLRGFAITTIIGILIGVLITRPAYSMILKKVLKLE